MENNKPNKKNDRVSNISNKTQGVIKGTFVYTKNISVRDLSTALNVNSSDIIKKLFLKGKAVTINTVLDDEIIGEICIDFGFDFKKEKPVDAENFEQIEIDDDPSSLVERAPIVTVMGHVDHGKTTLIDYIRKSHLVDKENGGISQEIGAYQIEYKGKPITFIDTPGHEAFSAMRSRGASVTDIVILIVAADDGVMPQTIEAIDHAKLAKVPVVVTVNKIDKEGSNPRKVEEQLMSHDIISEKFGGENIFVEISAKTGQGVDQLLDAVLTLAEMKELKANPSRFALGTCLEAQLDKGEGPKASLIVQNGTLKKGDYIVVGPSFGCVRRITNDLNAEITEAGPSKPVSIIGLNEVPQAGDSFMAFPDEKTAKDIANKRLEKRNESLMNKNSAMSLNDLMERANEGKITTVPLIIRADSTGSCEAIVSSINKINVEGVKIEVIRSAPGGITEGDILLAKTANAIIYAFNVRPNSAIKAKAEEEKIEIRYHNIIYALIEELENASKGFKKKTVVEKSLGECEVRHIFKGSKIGTIAGSFVTSGLIRIHSKCRLIRDSVVIYEGEISSLKRFKDDAKEVKQDFECGLTIANFNDIKEGDRIECFEMVEE